MDDNIPQPKATFETLKERLGRRDKATSNVLTAQEQLLRLRFLAAPRHVVNLFGRSYALLTLTPESVGKAALTTLSSAQPAVEFALDLASTGRISLDTQSWTSHGTRFDTGIHMPKLAWPPFCVGCLSEATDRKILEITVRKGSFGGKWTVSADQDTADRIASAALDDRYWLPIPCCRDHADKLSGLDLSYNGSKATLVFGNMLYAALFQYLNPSLSGTFKSQDCREGESKSNIIIGISVVVALVALAVAFLLGVSNRDALVPALIVGGLAVLSGIGGLVYARRIARQHEQPVPFDIAEHARA